MSCTATPITLPPTPTLIIILPITLTLSVPSTCIILHLDAIIGGFRIVPLPCGIDADAAAAIFEEVGLAYMTETLTQTPAIVLALTVAVAIHLNSHPNAGLNPNHDRNLNPGPNCNTDT